MHRNRLFTILILLPAAICASAQDIDPTVEVSRTYQGKMMEVHKPMISMQIPDSVMQFDLDFDYSVFDSPYKGTYEFNPYLQDMKPHPAAWTGSTAVFRLCVFTEHQPYRYHGGSSCTGRKTGREMTVVCTQFRTDAGFGGSLC